MYTHSDLICIRRSGANESLTAAAARDLASIAIPIPGGANVYLLSSPLAAFQETCDQTCKDAGYDTAGVASLALRESSTHTLATCTCYGGGQWPISPVMSAPPHTTPLFGPLGIVPGGIAPIDPYTFQTCAEFSSVFPVQGLMNMACVCKANPWPFADMSACKWAGKDRKAVDVPASPAVWIDDQASDSVKDGCARAVSACDAACSPDRVSVLSNASTIASVSGCFQFVGDGAYVSLMCQCARDGTYPVRVPGFSLMTSMDARTGRIPGRVSAASDGGVVGFAAVCAAVLMLL
ncbi:MAG: hypothetical protein SGCHY_005464 [Lobulomycetales sp.]